MSQEKGRPIIEKDINSLVNSKKVNKGELNDIMNYINEDKYHTQFFVKKSNINGYENIYGAFRSISKDKVHQKPQNVEPSYYYMNNYEAQYKKNMNNNSYLTNGKYNNNQTPEMNLIKKIILILFIVLIILLVIDFIKIYKKIEKDYKLERERCQKEYNENKCNEININDGPQINNICIEIKKCINDNYIYFHEVLIKYIRNILSSSFKGYSIYNVILFIFTILIISRFFF